MNFVNSTTRLSLYKSCLLHHSQFGELNVNLASLGGLTRGKVLNDGQLHYQHVWSPKDMDFLDHVICHYFILVSTICKSFCPSVHRFVSDLEFSQTLSFFHLLEAVLLEADGIDVDEAS